MDFNVCGQCKVEIEGPGIHYRGRSFCCDECCDEFEAKVVSADEPGEKDLSADAADDIDDDPGYRNGEEAEDEYDEDGFEIKPEDF